MKKTKLLLLCSLLTLGYGCATPILVGGAAVGGYYVGKEDLVKKQGTVDTPQKSSQGNFSDSSITSKINNELSMASGISSNNIDVDTYQGVVYLYGHVPNRDAERRVIKIAESTNGVSKVVSKLAITGR